MTHSAITHFVFVDFENVPKVDLGLISGKPLHVTLLIGKKQTRLDLTLVRQIHQLAAQVELIEVGASGHNALDLTLGYYLGQAVERTPAAQFFIVSKDKDFDPLIEHLRTNGTKVSRHDAFAALPFLPQPKKASQAKSGPVKTAAAKGLAKPPVPPAKSGAVVDRLEKLIVRLKNSAEPKPKKRSKLLSKINTDFGNKLTVDEQEQKLAELVTRGILSIDAQGKVSYL